VLAAQMHRDDRREASDDKTLGVDEKPFLLDIGRFGRMGLTEHGAKFRKANAARRCGELGDGGLIEAGPGAGQCQIAMILTG
jgi:hypothetical protein